MRRKRQAQNTFTGYAVKKNNSCLAFLLGVKARPGCCRPKGLTTMALRLCFGDRRLKSEIL
jgi:hypothetical protein